MGENKNKIIIVCSLVAICLAITIILYASALSTFGIVATGFTVVMFLYLLITSNSIKNGDTKYTKDLNRILKTYDAILVESISKPYLKGKNIIVVSNIVDLVDAQIEVRKPIYYTKSDNACDFMILDSDQAMVFIMKENENITTPLEREILDMGVIINSSDGKTQYVQTDSSEVEEKVDVNNNEDQENVVVESTVGFDNNMISSEPVVFDDSIVSDEVLNVDNNDDVNEII